MLMLSTNCSLVILSLLETPNAFSFKLSADNFSVISLGKYHKFNKNSFYFHSISSPAPMKYAVLV